MSDWTIVLVGFVIPLGFALLLLFVIFPLIFGFAAEKRWTPWSLADKFAEYGKRVARYLEKGREK